MKAFLIAALFVASNAFAYDALKIYTIQNADLYDLSKTEVEFVMTAAGSPRVSILAIRNDGLRGHPELSRDYYLASVPGLTYSNGDYNLVFEGTHLCAETANGRVRPTDECEIMVEKNATNELEVSIVVNH